MPNSRRIFSQVKRSLNGTYHAVSKKHLPRYVSQWAFMHNTRELSDGERIAKLFKKTDGKRLRYREPLARSSLPIWGWPSSMNNIVSEFFSVPK